MKFQMQNKTMDSFAFSSLTDVIFQLLIFFMLTASFVSHSGIKVELPKASQGTPPSEQNHITISITSRNQIFLNNSEVSLSVLGLEIQKITKDLQNPVVILNADKDVNLQKAIEIIDIAKSVGCTKYLLATDAQKEVNLDNGSGQ